MIRPSCSASSPKRCWRVTRGSNLGPIRSSTSCPAARVQRQDRIIVTLPASEITDGVAENLHLGAPTVLRGAVDAGSAQDPGGLAARAFRSDPVHDPQRCSCGRPTTKAAADFDHRMSGVSVSPLELDRALLAAAAHRDGATTNDA